MIVYKTTNLVNGKIYVGKDCNNNPSYLGSGEILKRAIKKYGRNSFKKEILELCDMSNINEKEKEWIEKLGSRNHDIGYNITEGGEGVCGLKMSELSKNKMSIAKIGKPGHWLGKKRSKETCMKIRIANSGRKDSEEQLKRKSLAFSGVNNPMYGVHNTGEKAPNFGKKFSEESRLKMSKSAKARHKREKHES